MASPHLLMGLLTSISPELNLSGVSPKWAPTVFDLAKRSGTSTPVLEGQGGDRPHTGNGHQAAAQRVPTHDLQNHAVQTVEFRHESTARHEHGLDCGAQAGTIGDECADPRREPPPAHLAELQAERLEGAADLVLDFEGLALQQLAVGHTDSR